MNVLNPSTSACDFSSSIEISDSYDDFRKSELDPWKGRHINFMTYLKANVASGQRLSLAVTKALAETGTEVIHWACH